MSTKLDPLTGKPVEGDEALIDQLRQDIERLADEGRIMYSRSALTGRQTQHKQFINGAEVYERRDCGDTIWSKLPIEDLITAQRVVITRYRESITGPVDLVWRCEPEIRRSEEGVSLYTRLCFEPVIVKVANGVWVESRLSEGGWSR